MRRGRASSRQLETRFREVDAGVVGAQRQKRGGWIAAAPRLDEVQLRPRLSQRGQDSVHSLLFHGGSKRSGVGRPEELCIPRPPRLHSPADAVIELLDVLASARATLREHQLLLGKGHGTSSRLGIERPATTARRAAPRCGVHRVCRRLEYVRAARERIRRAVLRTQREARRHEEGAIRLTCEDRPPQSGELSVSHRPVS